MFATLCLILVAWLGGVEAPPEQVQTWLGVFDLESPTADLGPGRFADLGGLSDPANTQFARLAWATYGPEGMIFAVDQTDRTLKVFRPDGSFLTAYGGSGEGPGEFKQPNWVGHCSPSTVTVWDFMLDRLTEFSMSGEVVGTLRIPDRIGYMVSRVRCHRSGRYVIIQRDVTSGPSFEGPYWIEFLLQTMIGLTGEIKDLGVVSGQDRYRFQSGDMPAPLGASLSFAPTEKTVFLTSGSEARVYEIDLTSGDTIRVLSWDPMEREINQRLRERVINVDLDRASDRAPSWVLQEKRAHWRRMRFPERLPETYALHIDQDRETLWIQVSQPPIDQEMQYPVYLGVPLEAPDDPMVLGLAENLSVFGIGDGEVLGRLTGPLGVELLSSRRIVVRRGGG